MTKIIFLSFVLLLTRVAPGQNVLVRFEDTTTRLGLIGYKDLKGNIKIAPKFAYMPTADTFYNIIAVMDSSFKTYYCLKNGKAVGRDSVYMIEGLIFPCESEGKILFHDKKKDRVGYLDTNGFVVIPAIYNYATPFRNGIAVAHRNAKRKCWGREDTTNCEHLGWEGGESILINEQHVILADSVNISGDKLNWYSLKTDDNSLDTSLYVSIRGKQGKAYFFIDYEKEFKKWLYTHFIPALSPTDKNNLKNYLFSEVEYCCFNHKSKLFSREKFLDTFPSLLTSTRFDLTSLKTIWINKTSYPPVKQRKYYSPCGGFNDDRYPAFDVTITWYSKPEKKFFEIKKQEHFSFMRTEEGYKLMGCTVNTP